MSDPRTRLVGAGYDAMPQAWEGFRRSIRDDPRGLWLQRLLDRLPQAARIVELGCGNGTDETRALAAHGRLTGVDLSEEQLRRARARVPGADFVRADLLEVEFDAGSVDAVASFYVFNHVPRDRLEPTFRRIRDWLRVGGWFLASLGVGDMEGWTGEWLGVEMYFSSYPPETNVELLRRAGFVVEEARVETIMEPEGAVEFQWILARAVQVSP